MVDIASPLFIETNDILDDLIAYVAIYQSSGTLIANAALAAVVESGSYVSSGCFPLGSEYRVKVVLNYDLKAMVSLCPKQLVIDNLAKFLTQDK